MGAEAGGECIAINQNSTQCGRRPGRLALRSLSKQRHRKATVTGLTLAALEAGRAYVNVHTRRNPGGEIRAQIPAIPLTITP